MKKDKKKPIPISLNSEELKFIDRCSEAAGMSRSAFILSTIESSKIGKNVRKEMNREKKCDVLPGQISLDLSE